MAESRETAFPAFRLPGFSYCLRNFPATHLTYFLSFAFFDVKKRGFACN